MRRLVIRGGTAMFSSACWTRLSCLSPRSLPDCLMGTRPNAIFIFNLSEDGNKLIRIIKNHIFKTWLLYIGVFERFYQNKEFLQKILLAENEQDEWIIITSVIQKPTKKIYWSWLQFEILINLKPTVKVLDTIINVIQFNQL